MSEFVFIQKDDVKTLGGPVTRQALKDVYAPKGWREATAEEVHAFEHGVAKRQEVQQTLTAAQVDEIVAAGGDLNQIAFDRGVDPTQFKHVKDLVDAIKATL